MINKVQYGNQAKSFGASLKLKGDLSGLNEKHIIHLGDKAHRVGDASDEIVVKLGASVSGEKNSQRSIVAATNINGKLDAFEVSTPHFNRTLDKPFEHINMFLTKLINTFTKQ